MNVTIGRYLVIEIGCLECGDATTILGAGTTPEEAFAIGGPGAKMATDIDYWSVGNGPVIFDLTTLPGVQEVDNTAHSV